MLISVKDKLRTAVIQNDEANATERFLICHRRARLAQQARQMHADEAKGSPWPREVIPRVCSECNGCHLGRRSDAFPIDSNVDDKLSLVVLMINYLVLCLLSSYSQNLKSCEAKFTLYQTNAIVVVKSGLEIDKYAFYEC